MKNIIISDVSKNDTQNILDIYSHYILNSPATFEYDVPDIDSFQKRIDKIQEKYPYLKAEINNVTVGFAYASALKDRPAYNWACEVTIYLHKDYKYSGIGSYMYSKLFDILLKQNITNLYACVTLSNTESINFHKKLGFKQTGIFSNCGYKFNQWYSVAWLEKIIADHLKNPKEFIIYKNI